MAGSAIKFLITNSQLAEKCFFFHFKHCFWMSLWPPGWMVISVIYFLIISPFLLVSSLFIAFLKGLDFPVPHPEAYVNHHNFYLEIILLAGQLASSSNLLTSCFFLSRKPLIGGGRRPSRQSLMASLLRAKMAQVGRTFPVRTRVTAWLIGALRRLFLAGHGSSKTLTSHFTSQMNGGTTSCSW